LGDGDFLEAVLPASREQYERQYAWKAAGTAIDRLAAHVAELLDMEAEKVWRAG
jgi:hypothetical protein